MNFLPIEIVGEIKNHCDDLGVFCISQTCKSYYDTYHNKTYNVIDLFELASLYNKLSLLQIFKDILKHPNKKSVINIISSQKPAIVSWLLENFDIETDYLAEGRCRAAFLGNEPIINMLKNRVSSYISLYIARFSLNKRLAEINQRNIIIYQYIDGKDQKILGEYLCQASSHHLQDFIENAGSRCNLLSLCQYAFNKCLFDFIDTAISYSESNYYIIDSLMSTALSNMNLDQIKYCETKGNVIDSSSNKHLVTRLYEKLSFPHNNNSVLALTYLAEKKCFDPKNTIIDQDKISNCNNKEILNFIKC